MLKIKYGYYKNDNTYIVTASGSFFNNGKIIQASSRTSKDVAMASLRQKIRKIIKKLKPEYDNLKVIEMAIYIVEKMKNEKEEVL